MRTADGSPGDEQPAAKFIPRRSERAVWIVAAAGVVLVAVLAFGAYRQPELLLNLMGLRYCG